MTPALTLPSTLDPSVVKHLADCQGPCITMMVPDHHPGAQHGSRRVLLRGLMRTARESLDAAGLVGGTSEFWTHLEEVAEEPGTDAGGPGFAIFRSPDFMGRYITPGQHPASVIAGHRFHLTPFLRSAFSPKEFFVLGLSKKHLRLLRYANGACQVQPLPAAVPASLEAALGLDKPEHNSENRSSVGSSTGDMRAIRFGTSSDREASGECLSHFFSLADRGLNAVLGNRLLLLMGVHEEVSAYRRAAKYGHILSSEVHGSPEFLSLEQIAVQAEEAALAEYDRQGELVLAQYKKMLDRSHTMNDLPSVIRAAAEGRVHRLCLRRDTHVGAEEVSEIQQPNSPGEDLINLAAIETLRTGGEVYVSPETKLPAAHPVAAILRY